MIPEFIAPSFINENDPDTIQERMMQELPADIDNTPGGFPWDFTRPTANEKSELIQFHLVQTLMLMFPMWAWGEWLDYHAQMADMSRRPAGRATGKLLAEGVIGTIISVGSVFATPATESPSIEFISLNDAIVSQEGYAEFEIEAAEAGNGANVAAHTITLMTKPIKGISSLTNPVAVTGGTEEEDDESLRERIQERNENLSTSFVGNNADYIRWSKEVVGVGSVAVLPYYEADGSVRPGGVKLIVLDANGEPANERIRSDIYNHIMAPDLPLERKAPIGAELFVEEPDIVEISYEALLHLLTGYTVEEVTECFRKKVLDYYDQAKPEGVLRYTKLAAILSQTEGVGDYTDFKVNGAMDNISLDEDAYPKTKEILFTWPGAEEGSDET